MQNLFGRFKSKETESEWLSVSDLMSGLMVIFLFIAIAYIHSLNEQQKRAKEIAIAWEEKEAEIYQALEKEFRDDLPEWEAELRKDLRIRFKAPDVLFESNKSVIRDRFKKILNIFFPRYVGVLRKFHLDIEEIRIEGHTSSEWAEEPDPKQAYFKNMALSQERTRAVLEYTLSLPGIASTDYEWVQPLMTANGLSSSKTITDSAGRENKRASRRVEFQVRSKVRTQIIKILEEIR